MSRKFMARIVAILLIVGVLVGLGPLAALAAPPAPTAPVSAPEPAAPPVPPPVPSPGVPVYYVVQWGDTLTRIAWRFGTTVWAIAQANSIWNVDYIRTGQVLLIPVPGPIPGPQPTIYIVQPGDTLSMIAWRFGTTVWALAQANGIWNPNLIYIGQRLYIQ